MNVSVTSISQLYKRNVVSIIIQKYIILEIKIAILSD